MFARILATFLVFLLTAHPALAINPPGGQKAEATSEEKLPVGESVQKAVDLLVAEARFRNNQIAKQLIVYVNELDTLTVNYSLDEAGEYDIRIDRDGTENQIWLRPEYITYNPYVFTTLMAYGITQLHGLYSPNSRFGCIDSVVHAYEMQARLWESYHSGPKINPQDRIETIFNQNLEMVNKGTIRGLITSDQSFLSFCSSKKV